MKKKSSSRIHVSKVESAREISLTKQSSMRSFDIKQRESKRPSTARPKYQNFIPPFKLLPTTISKFENTPRPESSTLRFLTEPSKYSDPSSINTFIIANNFTQQEHDSAKKIQKAWRKMKENRKTSKFLYFAFKLYKSNIKYPMHLWLLARRFPASISKAHYDIVVNYMKSRSYLRNYNNEWLTPDLNQRLLTFNQYCKTNCFLIDCIFDIEKIIKFVKILMRPLIRETFLIWHEMSETSKILSKQHYKIKTTYKYRINFHELFWTFIFWRRWSKYHKTKNIDETNVINQSIYLLEWNIYHGKKIQKKNIIRRAFCMRNDRLQYYAFITMRKHCLEKIKHRNEYQRINKVCHQHLMSLAFRSILFHHVQCSIEKSMKYRVLSSWYRISDKSVINKACLKAMNNRTDIRLMIRAIKQFKINTYESSLYLAYLVDSVLNNQLLTLKISFFLQKDFVHYMFVSSFIKWKKLIWYKKRAKMFSSWSFYCSKKNALKAYLFDLVRVNSRQSVDYLNYFPFKSEMDKHFSAISKSNSESSPISLKKRKSKQLKLINEGVNSNFKFNSFTASVSDTLRSFQKVDQFQCFEDDWSQKVSSDQVKSLFYHMVIVKSYLNKGKFQFKINREIHPMIPINEYREKNNLLTTSSVRKYRISQEEIFEIKRKAMVKKLNRDALLLAKKDVYLALVAFNEVNPQFSIEPKKTFEESIIIREDEINSPPTESISDVDEVVKRKQKHPFLNPINSLKDGIKKTNRKARRPPKQIFTEETNQSVKNRSIRIAPEGGIKSNRSKREDPVIVYEKHQKVTRENREKYLLEKKRKEREQLKNMPPPFEKMPTIKNGFPPKKKEQTIHLSSHLEVRNESLDKFMSSQEIDLSKAFKSRSSSKLATIKESLTEEEEEEEYNDDNALDVDRMMSRIEKVSFPYLNNDKYLSQSSIERRDLLTNKYFSILDVLLSKQKGPKFVKPLLKSCDEEDEEEEEEEEALELPQNCVSRVLRALMPPKSKAKRKRKSTHVEEKRRKSKLRRKPLFRDRWKPFEKVIGKDGIVYSKSSDPQFSNVLFLGDRFMSKLNLSGKLPTDRKIDNPNKSRKIRKGSEEEEEEEENDDSLSSSFDIPGFHHLLGEIDQYLKSGVSYQLSIDEQEKNMVKDKDELGNSEKVMLVLNKLARNAIKSESLDDQIEFNKKPMSNDELVYIDENASQTVSDQVSSSSKNLKNRPNKSSKSRKKKFKLTSHLEFKSTKEKREMRAQKRKLNANTPIVVKKKFTFTQDLLNSIHEASRIAHPLILTYYDDVAKIDPFEGLDTLKKNIRMLVFDQISIQSRQFGDDSSSYYSYESNGETRKQKEREKEREKERIIQRAFMLSSPYPHQNVKPKPSADSSQKKHVYAEEFILSIDGKPPRKKSSSKAKKRQTITSIHPNTLRSINSTLTKSDNQKDLLKVDSLTIAQNDANRPKTSWSKVKQDVVLDNKKVNCEFSISSLKFPDLNQAKRPRSRATKMTATLPSESPEFSVIQKADDTEKVKTVRGLNDSKSKKNLNNPKWIIETDPAITNDDIEFFLFTTPFIIPPKLINETIERKKKEGS